MAMSSTYTCEYPECHFNTDYDMIFGLHQQKHIQHKRNEDALLAILHARRHLRDVRDSDAPNNKDYLPQMENYLAEVEADYRKGLEVRLVLDRMERDRQEDIIAAVRSFTKDRPSSFMKLFLSTGQYVDSVAIQFIVDSVYGSRSYESKLLYKYFFNDYGFRNMCDLHFEDSDGELFDIDINGFIVTSVSAVAQLPKDGSSHAKLIHVMRDIHQK